MKIKFLIIIFFLFNILSNVSDALARPIISGISTNEINIDTKFSGTEILLFGAKSDVGDVIIVVRGPKKDYIVSKKGQVLGIWYNVKRLKFDDAYSYYSIFSTDSDFLENEKLSSDLEIGQDNIKFNIIGKAKVHHIDELLNEFRNKLQKDNLYSDNQAKIEFLNETLFKVILQFPKNISSGVYTVEIYLLDDNNLSAFQSIPIYVNQVGLSARIHDMAYKNSVLYGIMAVLIALFSGWIANFIFNKFFGK